MNTAFKLSLAGVIALALSACGGQKEAAAPAAGSQAGAAPVVEKTEIRFGVTPGDFGDQVRESIQAILEKKGYKVTVTEYPDYVTPNKALAENAIDINVFQHKPYLDSFKAEHKLDLVEAFQVPTAPLGMYGGKLTALDQVKDGVSVSVPNDPSNFARALVMLNDLGWIKLKDGIDPLKASKADIAENTKNIQLVEMEAANLPRSRQDVDFAIVNGNYAMSSGMKLTETLFQEPSFAYVNWSAVRTADKDSQWVKDVTDAYNSDEFKSYAHTKFVGYKFPAAWGEGSVTNTKAEASAASAASGAK
ncbi:MetQ/NlpA family ABC transporter substrate-binding protein [Kingella kingae]|uniref:MetQ/NlpA family ABC transporter substrate-binding protein n=1 Tax=Kingella kingae TaxID=504 RepID=UPI0003FD4526|nr:MetQ/NlpA family ABC transporter substrate-binding protein [Kingella kingae]MDK4623885.1 MetQ/NlpA family ABC transporter substrate-binding protein [Kingella kingae]MDK4660858.1 MetQ/NlpA family ABC transporter substrate-binding protein [Kingella kingae]MDK4667418.1 MetQ/NlpA family ABC transporter substrate-binding protein [Kingella kingae]MDK4686028.1 MetQ/NlpA family ABC transporter substrate-binding protein [Kingella kingae]